MGVAEEGVWGRGEGTGSLASCFTALPYSTPSCLPNPPSQLPSYLPILKFTSE